MDSSANVTSDSDADAVASVKEEVKSPIKLLNIPVLNSVSVITDSPPQHNRRSGSGRNSLELRQPRSRRSNPLPPDPEQLMITERLVAHFRHVPPFMDTHCHIDFILNETHLSSWAEIKEYYASLKPRNFGDIIQVFCDPRRFSLDDSVVKMLENEDNVFFSFGCHPKRIDDMTEEKFANLQKCLRHPQVRALGEIGLDYSKDNYLRAERQKAILRQQLPLAVQLNLPLVLHCREGDSDDMDADDDLMNILKEIIPKHHPIHLHCFTRDFARAERWLTNFPNLYIGLTPLVTFRYGNEAAVEVAQLIPLDRLLLETDSPFFIPYSMNRRMIPHSLPWFSVFVAERIAELRDIPMDLIIRMTHINARKLYNL